MKKKYPNTSVDKAGLSSFKLLNGVAHTFRGFTQSIREACLLIKHADLFICNAGGLMPGAKAVGMPTISIWDGL